MSQEETDAEFVARMTAKPGTTWVCGACGKNGPVRFDIGDESCFMNAVLCQAEKVDGVWVAVEMPK